MEDLFGEHQDLPSGETKAATATVVDDSFVPNPDMFEQLLTLGFDVESSKLALKQVNNSSLDQALDYISTLIASKD